VQEPRFPALFAPGPKAFDFALAQATITPARGQNVDFSVPYLQVDQGVLLSLQTLARPTSIADLRAMRLCAQGSSTGADLVTTTIRPAQTPLLPGSVTVLTRGLRNGRCEAVVYDAPSLATLRTQVPSRYGPLAGVIRTGESYGAVFAKGSRLRGPVNRALAGLRNEGTIATLQKRWLTADLEGLPVLR
jgi:polar amino acid transport system substrate-binding protein